MDMVAAGQIDELAIDLQTCQVRLPQRHDQEFATFEIEPSRRQMLLNGWDEIALTLQMSDKIKEWEERMHGRHPWLARPAQL